MMARMSCVGQACASAVSGAVIASAKPSTPNVRRTAGIIMASSPRYIAPAPPMSRHHEIELQGFAGGDRGVCDRCPWIAFWRAQFSTEVVRPKRFELLTARCVVQKYVRAVAAGASLDHDGKFKARSSSGVAGDRRRLGPVQWTARPAITTSPA